MQNLTIRAFEERNIVGILRIERESFRKDAWEKEVFLDSAAAQKGFFLVARIGRNIAGYVIACGARGGAEIASLAVRPRYRGQGIATALLQAILRKLKRAEVPTVWLMVRRSNAEAIRLYRWLGFVRVATVPNYYPGGAAGWRMKKVLGREFTRMHANRTLA